MSLITIHSVNLIAECENFYYNSACSVCLNDIKNLCGECTDDNIETLKFCPIIIGECKHAFHSHCIDKCLKINKKCPYDNMLWKFSN